MSSTGRRLLLASALLLALAHPPLHLVFPAFLALLPLALWVDRLARNDEAGREAFRGGLLVGAVSWGLLLHWIVWALVRYSWLAVPAYLATVAALAGLTGLVVWTAHRLRARVGLPTALALPLAWTAGEWLRAHLPGPLAFPWLELGTSLTGYPELVGVAELVGARGVTFWLALVAGVGAAAVERGVRTGIRGAVPWGVAAVVVAVLPAGWGVWRASTLSPYPVGRVAVVQPAVPQPVRLDSALVTDSTAAALERLRSLAARADADLVVLPEALFPTSLGEPGAARVRALLRDFADSVGAPLLLGGLGRAVAEDGTAVPTNSVFLLDEDGLRDYRYDKHHLVPIVERVPLLPLPWLDEGFAGYRPGTEWPVAEVEVGLEGRILRVGPMICYESSFADVARGFRLAGAHVLVNVTNDAWFGGGGSGRARTAALWQHPAHLVMRAVETRAGVVRAANTGISMFVSPVGRIVDETPLFRETVVVRDVTTTDVRTLYTRVGDVVGTGCILVVCLLVVWSLRDVGRDRRRSGRAGAAT